MTWWMTIGLIAAVYGLADGLWRLMTAWLFCGKERCAWIVIPLHRDGQDAEYRVRSCLAARRFSALGRAPMVLLDCGLTENGRRLVQRVGEELELPLCGAESFSKIATDGLQEFDDVV